MFNITILGGQGSGKGTQVPTIQEFYKESTPLLYLTTGALCREAIASGSELGELVASYINKGDLVPDDTIFEMLRNRVNELKDEKGILFDGMPRTLEQTYKLDDLLLEFESKIDLAISIEVPFEVLLMRITGRRVCPKCGENFHTEYKKPQQDGICDKCGAKLIQREDDADEEAIKQRLSIFLENNESITNYYAGKNRLLRINGDQTIEEVSREITQKLSELTPNP